MNYWQRLEHLKIFSLERRRERYMIFYVWKVFAGIAPNPGFNIELIDRQGGIQPAIPGNSGPLQIRRLKERSVLMRGVQLFRCLPSHLRRFQDSDNKPVSFEQFKRSLDLFLLTVPDEPKIQQMQRRAVTNSILHQVAYRA